MDPVIKAWMFNHWIEDTKDQAELAKNHAYLLGSFIDPAAVEKIMNTSKVISSDEEFEKSSQFVRQMSEAQLPKRRRRHKG